MRRWLDLIESNFSDDTSTLLRNDGDGSFTDATYPAGMGTNNSYLGWGCGFVDIDNDRWPDVFLANGHINPEVDSTQVGVFFKEPKLLYRTFATADLKTSRAVLAPGVSLAGLA